MRNNPNHHVCIHGHFYQPMRENPWLGVIEDQDSAAPFRNWNARINAECYQRLTGSVVTDANNEVADLFNCYAHLSFNFGPTLLAWLESDSPETLARLRTADQLARQSYQDCGGAIAQGYNHMILPLADSADRATQILWGIREFGFRFGRDPESVWLPETAINMDTVRTLIDFGIKFVILSPFQASYVRRFGDSDWTGVPDGTIDTRLPYRLFEVDGAGRTHFDRYLDVFFYDKTLSTKVSFEHLLTNADRLEEETYRRFAPDATLPQIVLIATDGEIYGHHEKHGNRALAYFLAKTLQHPRFSISNLAMYLKENPPQCEVRLWEGLDGRGSSWSCSHGVARWESNCGCGGNGVWNQEWRAPLRRALEKLKTTVREITRRELGGMVYDIRDARNDYIAVILQPDAETRAAFVERHAQKKLSPEELVKLWSLLEAERNSLLMFTSCGWFFDELSGLEPVQNLRYALRAAELCAPYAETDPVETLRQNLAAAQSNIPEQGTGRDVFDHHVISTRYSSRAIVAVHALSRLLETDEPVYNTRVTFLQENTVHRQETAIYYGKVRAEDVWTTAAEDMLFCAVRLADGTAGVLFPETTAEQKKIAGAGEAELIGLLRENGIGLTQLPYADRARFCRILFRRDYDAAQEGLQDLYGGVTPLLEKLAATRLPMPESLRVVGEQALRERCNLLIQEITSAGKVLPEHWEKAKGLRAAAARANLQLPTVEAAELICKIIGEKITDLVSGLELPAAEDLLEMLRFAHTLDLSMSSLDQLRDRFWRVLHLPARAPADKEKLRDALQKIGDEFGFVWEAVDQLLARMLP